MDPSLPRARQRPSLARLTGPLLPIVATFAGFLVVLSLSRLALVLWQWDRVAAVGGVWRVLGFGLRMDTSLLSYLLVVPALLALLMSPGERMARAWHTLLAAWIAVLAALLVFMEMATAPYVEEYGVRPSRIFIEYLAHPREVLPTVWKTHAATAVAGVTLAFAAAFAAGWSARRLAAHATPWSWRRRVAVLPVLLAVLVLGARAGFDHRPANASTAAFSNDPLVNDLGLSSTYTLLAAANAMRREVDAADVYGTMPEEEILRRTRAGMVPLADFTDPLVPTLHRQASATQRRRELNLVVVIEESMGAQFVGALGGVPLTPELDRLSREGLWLTQLYATGTRSARGLEALLTGFPPSPAQSVLKLPRAQDGFYTLAHTLAGRGYATEFIYGGESHFDSMAGFFLRNGFQRVIDQRDYANPKFRGTWGVSDEDLFERAHETLLAHAGKPFFAVVFTSSFHAPYEFPDGRIALHEEPKASPRNAVKYADHALGQFFRKARAAPYWDDTVFLIVADHDARVFGASLVPLERFHIPGLILGKSIAPARYTRPASQVDLAPTLLSLIGVDAEHPMIGHDLTRMPADFPGRALLQYERNHAYVKGGHAVVHEPRKAPRQFRIDDGRLGVPVPLDRELAREALAHALWPSLAYRRGEYRPPESVPDNRRRHAATPATGS